jgi:hypothetical protein
MAQTRFSGPVRSDNGFIGDMLSGTISASSGNITNLVTTTLTIGTAKVTLGSAVSGTVSSNLGYLQVMVGANTRYIGLFQSITL